MLIKYLIKIILVLLIFITSLISIYLIYVFNKLSTVDSFISKKEAIKVCISLPSPSIPSKWWESIDNKMVKNKDLNQDEIIDFYLSVIIFFGSKLGSNSEQSLIFLKHIKKNDIYLLVDKLNEFRETDNYKNLSLNERKNIEEWIEILDI